MKINSMPRETVDGKFTLLRGNEKYYRRQTHLTLGHKFDERIDVCY